MSRYDDDYPSCAETHATLRIFPKRMDPDEVTRMLGVEPTRWQRARPLGTDADGRRGASVSVWYLESTGCVSSRDSRRHVDWILDQVFPQSAAIGTLVRMGCHIDLCCVWRSSGEAGGPTISPEQMHRLAALGIELWFDVLPASFSPIQ